jgi:hypothetical protein
MTLYKAISFAALELSMLYMNAIGRERCKITVEISDQNSLRLALRLRRFLFVEIVQTYNIDKKEENDHCNRPWRPIEL